MKQATDPSKQRSPVPLIIVADDDKSVRMVIAQALTRQGYHVQTTATAAGMWDLSLASRGALLITDVGFPDGDALDMLPRLRARKPDLNVIVMSARANLLTAIQSQQTGAFDYLPKPFELGQLLSVTKQALAASPQTSPMKATISLAKTSYPPLLGRSPIMQTVFKLLARLAGQTMPVLIEGETGSGKSDVARALHELATEGEASLPPQLIIYNCEQFDQTLHEEAIFGAGGIFEQAVNGSLFINHVDQLSLRAQQRLIAALEQAPAERRLAPQRLLLGTSQNLRDQVSQNQFREDLYFAISLAPLRLPPLRERKEDIPTLATHFCEAANATYKTQKTLSHAAITALQAHDWPGNLRELDMFIRKIVMLAASDVIEAQDVSVEMEAGQIIEVAPLRQQSLSEVAEIHIAHYFETLGEDLPHAGLYDRIIEEVERPLIIQTLHATKGNQIKAAEILGLNRNTLRKKIEWLHISKDRRHYRDQ